MTVEEWLGKDNTLGIDIWKNKYQYENETFDEWLDRVSASNQSVKDLIIKKKFLFGGRILSNRGLNKKGVKVTLSNCYVIEPPEDNIESIYEAAAKLARTYSYGGGCGIDISNLAPRGAKVNNTAKYTSGAVSFMETYSQVTEQIGQNGRRGALMISLSCDHPDLEEFIDIKTDLSKVNKANISVRVSDKFMNDVALNNNHRLYFKRKESNEEIIKDINAKNIFMKLVENNWNYAEPGCLFWDTITGWNLLSNNPDFEYAGVNPCAEEPLPAGGSCLLGSLNLSEFVKNGQFNFEDFIEAINVAVAALNDVLDEGMNLHPLKEQKSSVKNWRQIGLGVMGIADMLIKMGIKYGSKESIDICSKIAEHLIMTATLRSCSLAMHDGCYPMCKSDLIVETPFFKHYAENTVLENLVKEHGLRNSQLLTIAPTGTLSTMLGISGGIEPIFANYYTRKTESLHGKDVYYKVYTPIVEKYMREHNIEDDSQLPDYFVTAGEISYLDRIAMQAAWQQYIDASISSTVNLPNEATIEDVYDLYMNAWKSGLKGITIFRDGCARVGVLTTSDDTKEEVTTEKSNLSRGYIIPSSDNLIGLKRKLVTGCGSLHCTAYFDPETKELREVYLSKGSTGGCNNFMIGLSRMISLSARGGVPLDDIIDQLKSTGSCPSYATRSAMKRDTSPGSCCPVAIAYALKDMHDQFINSEIIEDTVKNIEPGKNSNGKCPICGSDLLFEGGCNICKNCGWSKCD